MTTLIHSPLRDRPTWITYLQFAGTTCFMFAFGATQALLRDEQGTTRTISGLHSTSLAIGGLIGAFIAARAIGPLGRGRVIRVGMIASIVGAAIFAWPGADPWQSLLGIFVFSLFVTIFLVGANAFLLDHQGAAGPASMTEGNAFASAGGLLGPVLVGIGSATLLGWRAGIWATLITLVVLEAARGRSVRSYGMPVPKLEAQALRQPRNSGLLWSLVAIGCFIGTEFCITFWTADLLRERGGFSPGAAAGLVAIAVVGMLVGRIFGSRLARTVSVNRLLIGSVIVTLVACAVLWIGGSPTAILAGLALAGIGVSLQWPLGLSRAVEASEGQTDRASAWSSMAASISIAIAPLTLGLLSEGLGFRSAFLLVPVLQLIALAVLLVSRVDSTRS